MKAMRFRLRTLLLAVAVVGVLTPAVITRLRMDDPPRLKADDGPFLIHAHSFTGPDAERQARALAAELRADHNLPAYLWGTSSRKDPASQGCIVLIGDYESIDEAVRDLKRIRRIKPNSVAGGQGAPANLRRAMCTTNPLVSAVRYGRRPGGDGL